MELFSTRKYILSTAIVSVLLILFQFHYYKIKVKKLNVWTDCSTIPKCCLINLIKKKNSSYFLKTYCLIPLVKMALYKINITAGPGSS